MKCNLGPFKTNLFELASKIQMFVQLILWIVTTFVSVGVSADALKCSDIFGLSSIDLIQQQLQTLSESENSYRKFSFLQRSKEYTQQMQNDAEISQFLFLWETQVRSIPEFNSIFLQGFLPISHSVPLSFIDGRPVATRIDLPVHDLGHSATILNKIREQHLKKGLKLNHQYYLAHIQKLKKVYESAKFEAKDKKHSDELFEWVWFELAHESYLLHLNQNEFEKEVQKINLHYGDYYDFVQVRLHPDDLATPETLKLNKNELRNEILSLFNIIKSHFLADR